MSSRIPVVAIIGRTNVGKSTLFNALVGRRVAIVEDKHGVTRDRTYALVRKGDFAFSLIDTAGLFSDEERDGQELEQSVRLQSQLAIEESDLVIALFDGIGGLHPHDSEIVDLLRQSKKPVLWVINKCESPAVELTANEFYSLGIEDLSFVSAAHRKGMPDLVSKIRDHFPDSSSQELEEEVEDVSQIRIAVLGKPNVGKSTLINKLLGEDRLVTSDLAGTTTDSVDIAIERNGQKYLMIDTAGLRKKARVKNVSVERYANLRTMGALSRCDVAVLLIDATLGVPKDQDLKIAELIHERGRGLVIVVNKWDAIEKDHKTAKEFKDAVYSAFRFTRYAPVLFVSALTGRRCLSILDKAKEVFCAARHRIKTSDLNSIIKRAVQKNPPPVFRGESVKLYFATQIGVAPPKFVLFLNYPRRIDSAYERYLKNSIRDEYAFEGSDIKFLLRKRSEKTHKHNRTREADVVDSEDSYEDELAAIGME